MSEQPGVLHLSKDSKLNPIIRQIILPELETTGDVYLDLMESIVSQQISTKAAQSIYGRFCDLFPDRYPHAEYLSALSMEQLRSVGLSAQKAAYLQNIAQFSKKENLEHKNWAGMEDEAIIDYLTAIKGVGRWTVEMVLIFTLRRPDILPVDDLGIRQAFNKLYGIEGSGKSYIHQMVNLAEPWRPYRSLASRYLWRWNSLIKSEQ